MKEKTKTKHLYRCTKTPKQIPHVKTIVIKASQESNNCCNSGIIITIKKNSK